MTHVDPERWADLEAGRLSPAEAQTLSAHAAACARCEEARARVASASQSMRRLQAGSPPPLAWDRVGAQLYWSASSEMRQRAADPRARWLALLTVILVLLAIAVVAGVALYPH